MKDAERLIAWVREAADELERAHRVLDDYRVPRGGPEVSFSLAARIAILHEELTGEL